MCSSAKIRVPGVGHPSTALSTISGVEGGNPSQPFHYPPCQTWPPPCVPRFHYRTTFSLIPATTSVRIYPPLQSRTKPSTATERVQRADRWRPKVGLATKPQLDLTISCRFDTSGTLSSTAHPVTRIFPEPQCPALLETNAGSFPSPPPYLTFAPGPGAHPRLCHWRPLSPWCFLSLVRAAANIYREG